MLANITLSLLPSAPFSTNGSVSFKLFEFTPHDTTQAVLYPLIMIMIENLDCGRRLKYIHGHDSKSLPALTQP